MRRVEVVPPDPTWPEAFAAESQQISVALGENVVAIHHIGSTTIPNIYAKPVIDLLAEVIDLAQVDECNADMADLGYAAMGEFGIAGRRFFRLDNEKGLRTHHVHVFAAGSEQVARHLAFRDYMTAHPADAQRYSDLKQKLAQAHAADIEAYMDGKDKLSLIHI